MGWRKRSRSEGVALPEKQKQQSPEAPGLLQRIRNSWEFASLMQYIVTFGNVMKIDEEFDIEVGSLAVSETGTCVATLLTTRSDLADVHFFNSTGPGRRMHETRALSQVIGDWTVPPQMDLVASWSWVCFRCCVF